MITEEELATPLGPYEARVIADSVAIDQHGAVGPRLTTLEVCFPRFVLAEFNTHRMLSRNSASSRAIPVEKRIEAIERDPYVPLQFGKNKKGMQAGEDLDDEAALEAAVAWDEARQAALIHAKWLANIGVHKQWANRILEPFAWHTVVVTATDWENFFNLRISKAAQPEIRKAALAMWAALEESRPARKSFGQWHLPYVFEADWVEVAQALRVGETARTGELAPRACASELERGLARVSAARCARVSYLTHDRRRAVEADLDLYTRLVTPGHMSPLEHPAQVSFGPATGYLGNFRRPWRQLRKTIPGEAVFRGKDEV